MQLERPSLGRRSLRSFFPTLGGGGRWGGGCGGRIPATRKRRPGTPSSFTAESVSSIPSSPVAVVVPVPPTLEFGSGDFTAATAVLVVVVMVSASAATMVVLVVVVRTLRGSVDLQSSAGQLRSPFHVVELHEGLQHVERFQLHVGESPVFGIVAALTHNPTIGHNQIKVQHIFGHSNELVGQIVGILNLKRYIPHKRRVRRIGRELVGARASILLVVLVLVMRRRDSSLCHPYFRSLVVGRSVIVVVVRDLLSQSGRLLRFQSQRLRPFGQIVFVVRRTMVRPTLHDDPTRQAKLASSGSSTL